MNCTAARKLLFAFADGQLGVKDNCEVLDHLKMCPQCSQVVDEHTGLRTALGRTLRQTVLPESTRQSVIDVLSQGQTARPGRSAAAWRAYALAASLLLVAGVFLWRSLSDNLTPSGAPRNAVVIGNDPSTVQVQRGPSAATQVMEVHNACCAHGAKHHRNDLPTSLAELVPAINSHYENKIASLAPDLVDYGYRFESANYCGVRNKPGSDGGHLIYLSDKGQRRLSFFSVPRWDCLDKCSNRGLPNQNDCRKYEVEQDGGGKLAILAWHNDATTYICCGTEPFEIMEPMVKHIRAVLARFDDDARLALAGR